jgi:hypothetical protein
MNLSDFKISDLKISNMKLYNDFQYIVFNELIEKNSNQNQLNLKLQDVSNDNIIETIIDDFKKIDHHTVKLYYNDIIYRNSVYSNLPKLLIQLYDNHHFIDYIFSSLYEYIYYYKALQSDNNKSYIRFCQFISKYINYLYLNYNYNLNITIKIIDYGFRNSVPFHQYISYEDIFRFCHYDIASRIVIEHKQFFIDIFCHDVENSNSLSRLFEILDEMELDGNDNWKLIELLLNEKAIFDFPDQITINITDPETLYPLLEYLYNEKSSNIVFIDYIFCSPYFISLFNTSSLHSIIDDYIYLLLIKKSPTILQLIRHKLLRLHHLKYYLELDNYDDYEEKYLYESYKYMTDHIFIEIVKNNLFTQDELISIGANDEKYRYKFRFINCIKYLGYDIIEIAAIYKYFGFDLF